MMKSTAEFTADKRIKNTEEVKNTEEERIQDAAKKAFADMLAEKTAADAAWIEEEVLETGEIRYTMRNDYMFKAVLQENEEALKALLASLLGRDISEIREVKIENPIILGESIEEKTVILDIRVLLNNEECINIELQVAKQSFWKERTLFYVCRNFCTLNKGEGYEQVKPVIHIGIMDFWLDAEEETGKPEETTEENTSKTDEKSPGGASGKNSNENDSEKNGKKKLRDERFYSENVLTDRRTGRIYSEKLQVNELSLKNIEKATLKQRESGLYAWAKFFAAKTWEDLKMAARESKAMQSAVVTLKKLTADDKIRLQCEARERYNRDLMTWQSLLRTAETGKQKAEAEVQELKVNNRELEVNNQELKANNRKLEADNQKKENELKAMYELMEQNPSLSVEEFLQQLKR